MVLRFTYPAHRADRMASFLKHAVFGAFAAVLQMPAAGAQTPVPIRVANDLRACIVDAYGIRDAARIGQLTGSMAEVPNRRWTSVTEVAPGVFRITDARQDVTLEIKLPDATGEAHCMAFGPAIAVGQGALSADKFVDLNFVPGLEPSTPGNGMIRRYTLPTAPHPAALVAFSSPQVGDVVGFTFSGIPQGQVSRALSKGGGAAAPQNVRNAIGRAVNSCLRLFGNVQTVDAALEAYGFELGFNTGGRSPTRVFFTPDNAVAIQMGRGSCLIETNDLSVSAAVSVISATLASDAPGMFKARTENQSGCTTFFASPNLRAPIYLQVRAAPQQGQSTCTDNGTSRITISVAG